MAAHQPVGDSDQQEEQTLYGLLFRISIRVGALVFVTVLVAGVWSELGLEAALLRALLALVALTCCGWLAEQVALAPWRQPPLPAPQPAPETATPAPAEQTGDDT